MTTSLIDHIHNYCDRCCHRCHFADRCALFLGSRDELAAHAGDPTAAVSAAMAGSVALAMATVRQIATAMGVDVSNVTTDQTIDVVEQMQAQKVERAKTDALVVRGKEYALQAWPIARALRPILAERGDLVVAGAVERLEEICGTVASKIYRAVSGTFEPGFDPEARQSDANGSAKVARLLIEESRRAWRVLMQAGRATANGVPARLIICLDELEAGVASRFPHALEFVRPGFDTDDPDVEAGHLAQAVRRAGVPAGHA